MTISRPILKAPFPWWGGKSRAASLIWARFGNVPNYVEPFAGSLAVLLGRPTAPGIETVNDLDCFLSNVWRAIQSDPEGVAGHADWPVNEADLHARHLWLVNQTEFRERMKTDPNYFDVKIAGWWLWGISAWIGSGWCASGNQYKKRPHLANAGKGVHRQLPYLSSAGMGVHRQLPNLYWDKGINSANRGNDLKAYMQALADRLRRVRVCCGDWERTLGPSCTWKRGLTGVLLDPPYAVEAGRDHRLYNQDAAGLSYKVRDWAIANGDNRDLRIALCGYEGEYDMPKTWRQVPWKTQGGYRGQNRDGNGNGNDNARRERIWFNASCNNDVGLFDHLEDDND